jgi:putative hemolysin
LLDLLIILLLVGLNGVFAMSELAIVSSRLPRLRAMAEAGRPGARAALDLAEDPGRFLSTVQIGITLIGIVAGAFSGAALGDDVAAWFVSLGMPMLLAETLGIGLVIMLVTYVSIVLGELVPKRLALRNREAFACALATPMQLLARAGAPVVWLLDASGTLVFRLLRITGAADERVTTDDVRAVVAEAQAQGAIEQDEQRMIARVLRLGDRPVRGIMTPRLDVEWLDASADEATIRARLAETRRSRLPVGDGSIDSLLGVVDVRELLVAALRGEPLDLRARLRTVPVVAEAADGLDVLPMLRRAEVPLAFVHDEYGHFEGVITGTDISGAIVGDFRSDRAAVSAEAAVVRPDGSWLLAGWMPLDEVAETLAIQMPPTRTYQTLAGLLLHTLRRVPAVGETLDLAGWRFEVLDLDGLRIDKVLATPVAPVAPADNTSQA